MRHFAKRSASYTCESCGKLTRETGYSESSCRLCKRCYVIASYENQHSDEGHDGPIESCAECLADIARNGVTL